MIDNPFDIELLANILAESVPFRVTVHPKILKRLQQDKTFPVLSGPMMVEKFQYAGDEGGFICTLCFQDMTPSSIVISLTHLIIYRNHLYYNDILRYQKRRIKKLKRGKYLYDDA